jgi:hypothetical protein
MSTESDNSGDTPNSNGDWKRDERGRFGQGNRGGPGAPAARHAREMAERFDDAVFKTCAPDRLLVMMDSVLKKAEVGDIQAAEFIRRICQDRDIPMRLERLEEMATNNSR